tara:strand:+ start:261 stop:485 length:225 start_codon:yes stop_codon:yes gene_type:complete
MFAGWRQSANFVNDLRAFSNAALGVSTVTLKFSVYGRIDPVAINVLLFFVWMNTFGFPLLAQQSAPLHAVALVG